MSVDGGNRKVRIVGNPAQRAVKLTLRSTEHAEFVVSWANWCGHRSRAFYAVLRDGNIRRQTRIRVLPTCVSKAHKSSIEVVSVRADSNA